MEKIFVIEVQSDGKLKKKEVSGRDLKLKAIPEFTFFIHKSISFDECYSISEKYTGVGIATNKPSELVAISCLEQHFLEYGLEKFKSRLERFKIAADKAMNDDSSIIPFLKEMERELSKDSNPASDQSVLEN